MRIFLICNILLFISAPAWCQPSEYKMTPQQYFSKYKDEAIKEMLMHGVPASITLSQGMLESANGNSPLAVYANNHFGIKCHKGWEGLTFIKDDDEQNECFRKYANVLESYSDHSQFLKTRSRYGSLFELKRTDYNGWAKGLKEAGYATNSKYAELLIDIIEKYNLNQYDEVSEMPSIKPEPDEIVGTPFFMGRSVMLHNRVKYLIAGDGDTYFKISSDFNMMLWQIYKYNDLGRSDRIKPGQIIYLQPKRNKAKRGHEFHIAKKGETMYDISQKYAVKLKQLFRKNSMTEDDQPAEGQKLWLRKRQPSS